MPQYYDEIWRARRRFMRSCHAGDCKNSLLAGRRLIGLHRKYKETGSAEYAYDLYNLAIVMEDAGGLAESKAALTEAARVFKSLPGKTEPYINCINNMGVICAKMGRDGYAEKHFKDALRLMRAMGGEDSPLYLETEYNLANVYRERGWTQDSLKLHEEVLSKRKRRRLDLSDSLHSIARVYENDGQLDSAVAYMKQALRAVKKTGEDGAEYCMGCLRVAELLQKAGRLPEALRYFVTASAAIKKLAGEDSVHYSDCLNSQADVLTLMGDFPRALRRKLRVRGFIRNCAGTNHIYYANLLREISALYRELDDNAAANAFLEESLKIREGLLGREGLDYIKDTLALAGGYIEAGDFDKAAFFLQEAAKSPCSPELEERIREAFAVVMTNKSAAEILSVTKRRHNGDNE